jgi:hypothetical protein
MTRLHGHIAVEKLDDSNRFYSFLFGVAQIVVRSDYPKCRLEDSRVNFAISQRGLCDLPARPLARSQSPRFAGRERYRDTRTW